MLPSFRRPAAWWPAIVALVLLGWFVAGCGSSGQPPERKEARHPKIKAAERAERSSDFTAAMDLYEEVLMEDPAIGKAHLQLGLLYDEHRDDYLRALYHYETYLQLRPASEKAELVRELANHAKLSFAASLPDQPSEAIRHIAKLEQDLSMLERDLSEARGRIAELQQSLQRSRQELVQARTQTAPAAAPPAARPPAADPGGETSSDRQYEVRAGDNLSRIASIMYNDSTKWRTIYQANRDLLKRPEDLSPGQVLRIPRD